MKSFLRAFFTTLAILILMTVTFLAGFFVHEYLSVEGASFPILTQAYEILLKHGYSDIPPDPTLEHGMIQGMIAAYGDPYTSFVEPIQHELETNTLQGTFGGIGADVSHASSGYFILYPYPNSPAKKAGIREGDRLLQVNNLEVAPDTSMDEIQATLRGPVGEAVQLRVARPPEYTEFTISITREEIALPSVTWHIEPVEPRLGIIQINVIAATTVDEILIATDDLEGRGASAFVIDLRNNSGGLLDTGVDIARIYLNSGVIIEQQYRGKPIETYGVDAPGELADLPLVVFINQNTASAAEIIAGSLQANHRAILIGTPTYGKDTIQLVFELADGSSLHVTSARWWIPNTEISSPSIGIQPDILVDPQFSSPIDPYILTAIDYLFPN
jgi:carboxyl-terminal processing protease